MREKAAHGGKDDWDFILLWQPSGPGVLQRIDGYLNGLGKGCGLSINRPEWAVILSGGETWGGG